jgi:heterodisulfide reductase subunit D
LEEARSDSRVREIIGETRAYLCIDCSKCTGSCPIGKTGSVYSPRALVQHLMLEGRDPSETELWRCLTCGLCKERCPSDVDFPRFVSMLRQQAFTTGTGPQHTHGGTIRELMKLSAKPGLRQHRTAWLPDWVRVIGTGDSSEDLYFVGCAPYFDIIFEDFDLDLTGTHISGLELLKSSGVNPAVLADERCCGHDALWSGDTDLFVKLAQQNVELFSKVGAKRIFVSCPEGYYTFTHDYPKVLGDLEFEFVNTVAFLAEEAPNLLRMNGDTEVTYLDSCRMGRFSGLYDEPRRLLASAGVVTREMEFSRENAPCCGSNLWINCDSLSKKLQMDCLKAARETGARVLLTPCDKCRIHLACAQMEMGHVTDGLRTDNILRFLNREGVRDR